MTGRPWEVAQVDEVERLAYEVIADRFGLKRAQEWWDHRNDPTWDSESAIFEDFVFEDARAAARDEIQRRTRVEQGWEWR
jgi:hypothetical protein